MTRARVGNICKRGHVMDEKNSKRYVHGSNGKVYTRCRKCECRWRKLRYRNDWEFCKKERLRCRINYHKQRTQEVRCD